MKPSKVKRFLIQTRSGLSLFFKTTQTTDSPAAAEIAADMLLRSGGCAEVRVVDLRESKHLRVVFQERCR